MVIGALVSLMVHIAVKFLPHVTVLVLLMAMAMVVLIEAVIMMAFRERFLMGSVVGVWMVWVVHMVKVIDFPVVAMIDMANVMMINQKFSMITFVVIIVVVDVLLLGVAEEALCCLSRVLIEQV